MRTPGDLSRPEKHWLQLTASIVGVEAQSQQESVVEAVGEVPVMPLTNMVGDPMRRLHGTLSLRTVGFEEGRADGDRNRTDAFAQARIDLGGALDEAGRRHLRLVYQGPDLEAERGQRLREEAHLSFEAPGLVLRLGDFSSTLSPLILGSEGRGARLVTRRGRLSLGLLQQRSRRVQPFEERQGILAEWRLSERWRLGAVHLSRRSLGEEGAGGQTSSSRLSVLQLFADLPDNGELQLAFARGQGRRVEQGLKEDGDALYLQLTGSHWGSTYSLRYIDADRRFPGLYQDRRLLSLALGRNLGPRLRARIQLSDTALPLEEEFVYAQVPVQRLGHAGLAYRLPDRSDLSLDFRLAGRNEINDVETVDYTERTARLRWSKPLGRGRLGLYWDRGEGRDQVAKLDSRVERYGLQASYALGERVDVEAEVDWLHETSALGRAEQALSGSARARFELGESFSCRLRLRRQERQLSSSVVRESLVLGLERSLARGRRLSLDGHHRRIRGPRSESESSLVLAYTLPLSLPVGRRASVGSLRGQIFDRVDGRPRAGVLLQVGGALTRSDAEGRFDFPTLVSGTHPLQVYASRVGPGVIAAEGTPKEVVVEGGKPRRLDLYLDHAGVLAGKVELYRLPEGSGRLLLGRGGEVAEENLQRVRGLTGLVVQISDGSRSLRRVTGGTGRFVFEEVPPGLWEVEILPVGLPSNHRIVYDARSVELVAGQEVKLAMRVVPAPRKIQLIGVGSGGKS